MEKQERKVYFRRRSEDQPQPEGLAVKPKEGESFDSMLRRFKRLVDNSGILRECRERQEYKSPSEAANEKSRKAAKRRAKALRAAEEA